MGQNQDNKGEKSTPDFDSSISDITPGNVYTSPPFKFIVEGKTFYLHAALVSHHSKPLDRMMNGKLSEAQKGYATLEEVEEDTFGRFAEWINKGYYTPGKVSMRDNPTSERSFAKDEGSRKRPESPAESPQRSEIPVIEQSYDGDTMDWGMWGTSSSSKKKGRKKIGKESAWDLQPPEPDNCPIETELSSVKISSRTQLKESFIHRKATIRQESISIPPPIPNQRPEQDYTDVFLSHAQLYVFAEKYDIQTLKMLALENLQNILAIFTLYGQRTGDIVALLRYVYANTGEPVDSVEDLRTLMTHYMGYEMDTLMKDEEFRMLMVDDGGALLGDFMKMVMKRVN
ncbi:MAG: hypothetical protein Q9221_008837 [Calogaya cf. arnoldii]